MAFGESDSKDDSRGHWAVIPYNGLPAINMFVPKMVGNASEISVYWTGRLQADEASFWVAFAAAMERDAITFEVDLWSGEHSDPPKIYSRDGLIDLKNQFLAAKDATVSITARGQTFSCYVWASLGSGSTDEQGEVGMKLRADMLELSAGRSLLISLLQWSCQAAADALEYEELVVQLIAKARRAHSHEASLHDEMAA